MKDRRGILYIMREKKGKITIKVVVMNEVGLVDSRSLTVLVE